MTKTIKFHPKQGLKISPAILRQAGFPEKEEYVVKLNIPIINIIPANYTIGKGLETDWFDELLEEPIARENFQKIIKQAEKDIQKGNLQKAEDVFAEIKKERALI